MVSAAAPAKTAAARDKVSSRPEQGAWSSTADAGSSKVTIITNPKVTAREKDWTQDRREGVKFNLKKNEVT